MVQIGVLSDTEDACVLVKQMPSPYKKSNAMALFQEE